MERTNQYMIDQIKSYADNIEDYIESLLDELEKVKDEIEEKNSILYDLNLENDSLRTDLVAVKNELLNYKQDVN